MDWFLNSYQPLCRYKTWEKVHQEHPRLLPFTDGSCRPEPDLTHKRPGITALCRTNNLVQKLLPGHVVMYLAQKDLYGLPIPHFRFVAALLVTNRFANHEAAAQWYRDQGMPLPSNCIVEENPPIAWGETHQMPAPAADGTTIRNVAQWDRVYEEKVEGIPDFVVCEPLFVDLKMPPVILEDGLRGVFDGKTPGAQNPGKPRTFQQMVALLGAGGMDRTLADKWATNAAVVKEAAEAAKAAAAAAAAESVEASA